MDVAQLAATKVNYRSAEDALDYLFSKGEVDGLFNHDYIEGLNQACYLCHEPKESHRLHEIEEEEKNHLEEAQLALPQLIKDKSKNMADRIEKEMGPISQKACQICFEEKIDTEFFKGLGDECQHRQYCLGCTREQIKVFVNDSKVMKIKCFNPDCKVTFDDARVKAVLSGNAELDAIYIKYLKFKQMKMLDSDPLVKWCPKEGCDKFVRATSKFQNKLTCGCG